MIPLPSLKDPLPLYWPRKICRTLPIVMWFALLLPLPLWWWWYDFVGRASEKHSSPSLFSPSHPPRLLFISCQKNSFHEDHFVASFSYGDCCQIMYNTTTPSDMLVHTVAKSSPSKTRSRNISPRYWRHAKLNYYHYNHQYTLLYNWSLACTPFYHHHPSFH